MRMRGYDNNPKPASDSPKKSYDGHVYDQYADDTVAGGYDISDNNRILKKKLSSSKYDGIKTI